jgi:hypothetical protein
MGPLFRRDIFHFSNVFYNLGVGGRKGTRVRAHTWGFNWEQLGICEIAHKVVHSPYLSPQETVGELGGVP